MNANSTKTAARRKSAPEKPEKPNPDFPLFPHATRRWAKKIKGRLHYFGHWDDPDGALDKYLREKDYLHNGKRVPVVTDGLTVGDLCNKFLTWKKQLMEAGELTPRSFGDYHRTCRFVVAAFGKWQLVDELDATDFQKLRVAMGKDRGPVTLSNEITRTRVVFKYADDQGLIARPVRFGPAFKKPTRKTLRKSRAAHKQANGLRMLEADQIRKLLDVAPAQMKAMILLGVNCGLGNTDCANLPQTAVDLDAGWLDYAREKTGVERRCRLWPETVEALRAAIDSRPAPNDKSDARIVFLTHRGKRWVRTKLTGEDENLKQSLVDGIGREFAKLLTSESMKRPGLSFYCLRHVFQTIGEECGDVVAVRGIMGHVDSSMSDPYRERISDDRLRRATDHVRGWLFPKK